MSEWERCLGEVTATTRQPLPRLLFHIPQLFHSNRQYSFQLHFHFKIISKIHTKDIASLLDVIILILKYQFVVGLLFPRLFEGPELRYRSGITISSSAGSSCSEIGSSFVEFSADIAIIQAIIRLFEYLKSLNEDPPVRVAEISLSEASNTSEVISSRHMAQKNCLVAFEVGVQQKKHVDWTDSKCYSPLLQQEPTPRSAEMAVRQASSKQRSSPASPKKILQSRFRQSAESWT